MLELKKDREELMKDIRLERKQWDEARKNATKHKVEITILRFPNGGLQLSLNARERAGKVSEILYSDRHDPTRPPLTSLNRYEAEHLVKELGQLRAASINVKKAKRD